MNKQAKVIPEAYGPYSFLSGGEWFFTPPPLEKEQFKLGWSYVVETSKSPKGKLVVDKIVSETEGKKSVEQDKMSKADWASKDRRISRQGLIQAGINAASTLAAAGKLSLEQLYPFAEDLANKANKYVSEE